MSAAPSVSNGRVDRELAAEFPGLELRYCYVSGSGRRSPRAIRDQLKHLSDRAAGDRAIEMRREPITHAYRVFFRHIGLDPDETRTPAEAVMVERLRAGRFRSHDVVGDAVTVAIVETGTALMAFDAGSLDGPPILRPSLARERLQSGDQAPLLREGTIVLADRSWPIGQLFGDVASHARVRRSTEQVLICGLAVDGVPDIAIEDGLWKCASVIAAG